MEQLPPHDTQSMPLDQPSSRVIWHRTFWHNSLLGALFALAMLLTVLLVNVLVGVLLALLLPQPSIVLHAGTPWVVGLMLALLLTGAGLEWYRLRAGGHAIACRLGARPVQDSVRVYEEHQLLRVVEQVAHAAGLPVPVAYVLDDEPAINALVAGNQSHDMVLIVTWGALQTLDQDELRGMVAHELSHIEQGDTRLNLRLMAVLNGLLLISQMGQWILQFGLNSRRPTPQRAAWLWSFTGYMVWLMGSLGVFMGRFIKLAMLRQREFMADASSAQLTRSDAVLRVLLRIRAHDSGSTLYGMHAESISHLCFGSALMSDGWFSTHPSLDDRIGRLSEQALARLHVRDRAVVHSTRTPMPTGAYPAPLPNHQMQFDWQPPQPLPTLRVIPACADRPHLAVLTLDQRLSVSQPDTIRRALSTGAGCRELLAALMASRQPIAPMSDLMPISHALLHAVQAVDVRSHILLFYAALQGLGRLPHSAARQLLSRLALVVQADGHVSLADVLLIDWLKAQVGLLPDSLPIAFADCHDDIDVLIDAVLQLQQQPLARQTQTRMRVLQVLLHVLDPQYPPYRGPVDLAAVLLRLAGLPHLHRVSMIAVIETYVWDQISLSQEDSDLLALLRWRFGLCDSVLVGLTPERCANLLEY